MIPISSTQAWISLDLLPAIGPRTALRLIRTFRSPEAVFAAPAERITGLDYLNARQKAAILAGPDENRVRQILQTLDAMGARAVCLDDPAYPEPLREIHDPPCVLYVKGDLKDLQPAVAIVGTRSPTLYGRESACRLARDLSSQGVSIVSGLARGIDREAHLGALQGIARTVAVLGSGLDVIYPPEHRELSESVVTAGALVSEFPPGTRPDAGNFPRRNRIISGLCQAVVVVEASLKSGAMITARYALDQGRPVMAVPGNITNVRSQGPHQLIAQGALLVQDASDVIAEIAPQVSCILGRLKQSPDSPDDILTMASGSPVSIDEIATHLDIDTMEATRRVSRLELAGAIERIAGNRFITRSGHG